MDSNAGETNPSAACRFYSPAMLADLLGVSVADVRSWQRRGLIHPARESAGVAWFDFSQLAAGRQLVRLLGQGLSPADLQCKLRRLSRWISEPSLADLSFEVEGTDVLLRQDGKISDIGGQRQFDFGADSNSSTDDLQSQEPDIVPFRTFSAELADSETDADEAFRLKQLAEQLEDRGEIAEAIEVWRTFHLVCGPRADSCFRLGELLYLSGDPGGARERYFMALEMDPGRIEVRASLGCVLLELGETGLAISGLARRVGQPPGLSGTCITIWQPHWTRRTGRTRPPHTGGLSCNCHRTVRGRTRPAAGCCPIPAESRSPRPRRPDQLSRRLS